jgi:hypothetical protein
MRFLPYIFLVLFTASAGVARAQPPKFKGHDHSLQGGEYAVLNNLLLRDNGDEVVYAGREQVNVYSRQYEASKFVVATRVFVTVSGQSECFNADTKPFDPCQAPKEAEVEVFVGLDERGEIHDTMLRHVHDFWSATEVRSWKKAAEATEHLNYKDGEYILFQELRGATYPHTRAKRLVWVDGKFIKFEFKRFKGGGTYADSYVSKIPLNRDEALENFVGMGIEVRPRAVKIQPRRMRGSFREQFFRLYRSRAFDWGPPRPNNGMHPTAK